MRRLAAVLLALAAGAAAAQVGAVDAAALARWLEAGEAVTVIDLRPQGDYLAGTPVGALHADPARPEAVGLPEGGGRAVLLLPADADEGLVARWGAALARTGYRAYRLAGGVEAWKAAGLALEVPGVGRVRPDSVPFVVPRGLCEMNTPAQVFR
ncbi:rhodanese-like domain-containing protein [Inmirania thermothiophila]|uniref:Rhodanese-related sulfurtransferase n=1 Tax=Inmirania thermothiophila TaxID=1750597 RepID=A0A3N1Y327_9GAMM|nr:rhodanese-like domain-containing protein [Inmirania thermothiophila]ROR31972.1 rhodanese-related sulfurtransferase [Inmirania thermothiophila]